MIKQIYKNREVKMKEQVGSINILSACFPYTIYIFLIFRGCVMNFLKGVSVLVKYNYLNRNGAVLN